METNLTSIHKDTGSISCPTQWVKGSGFAVSCGVGRRRNSDLALLRLWCRPVATTPILPLAWEPPYAVRAAPEKDKKKRGGSIKGILVWCSELKIQHCHCRGLGHCCGPGSTPSLEISACCGCSQKKKIN